MKNLKTIFILFFVLSACGYQPLLVKKEINFKFNSIETIGNDRLSYRVIRGLNHLQDKNSKYDIKINIIELINLISNSLNIKSFQNFFLYFYISLLF